MKSIRSSVSFPGVAALGLVSAVLVLTGCTSMGAGSGSLGAVPVSFSWSSKDGGSTGTMSAAIDGHGIFSGPFVQASTTVRTDFSEPIGYGWRRGWADWGYGGMPQTSYSTAYSSSAVATLIGPDGQPLRCQFQLNTAAAGMRGGGQGECRFSDGRSMAAIFDKS